MQAHKETKNCGKKLNKIRVKVEHIIACLKKFKILGEIYRGKIEAYNRRFKIIAGLTNYKRLGIVDIS